MWQTGMEGTRASDGSASFDTETSLMWFHVDDVNSLQVRTEGNSLLTSESNTLIIMWRYFVDAALHKGGIFMWAHSTAGKSNLNRLEALSREILS